MTTLQDKQDAMFTVTDAAQIHSQSLKDSLRNENLNGSFAEVRKRYIHKLDNAVATVQATRFDETLKVSERVRDLDLADAVALLHAVEDHIRSISKRSPLA